MNLTANSPRATLLPHGLLVSLVFLTVSCVTYESSLNRRYGYTYYPQQQQQPYYTPPNNQGYTPNDNPNNPLNQGFGQNPSAWNTQQQFGAPPITFQTFYDELAPYGEWINTPQFGFVWRPFGIDAGWRPYLHNGRWAYTSFGWTWVSDYIWGWAPFHYGRWQLDPFYGWVWHPGHLWGPAWVEWRFWNGHYCWVPLAPGINIGVGFRGGNYHWSAWNVVPGRFFTAPNLWNYCLPFAQTHMIIRNTTIITNTVVVNNNTYFTGPPISDVERYSGKVTPMALKGLNKVASSTINDNTITMYRPDVEDYSSKTQTGAFRPATVTPANQATTGKATILLSETPENADRIASPKMNPLTPNLNRDATDPMLMPPTGKIRPSGTAEESGSGGKVIPMPAPADDRKSNPLNPSTPVPPGGTSGGTSGGGVEKSHTKPLEQEQPRDIPPTKSSPTGIPYTKPQQQPQAEPPKNNTQPYKKGGNDDGIMQQQREEKQREEQRREEQQRYQKHIEEQREAQRQAEQQRQEQQRYQKRAEEQRQEQERRESEVKRTPSNPEQSIPKKKGDGE